MTMSAINTVNPEILLDENFEWEGHPADLEQVIEQGFSMYESIPSYTKLKKQYRNKLNSLIDTLTEYRGFKQYNYA